MFVNFGKLKLTHSLISANAFILDDNLIHMLMIGSSDNGAECGYRNPNDTKD